MPFTATALTMFPEAFPGPLGVSLIGTAWREQDLWRLETVDIRGFSTDKRGFLDDTPAGGGPGQVMRADVIASALDSVEAAGRPLLYMSARGRPLTQAKVREWSTGPGLIVLCGRFEGVDQRVLDARGFQEVAVGDAVIAGGEAAAMVTIEACVRLHMERRANLGYHLWGLMLLFLWMRRWRIQTAPLGARDPRAANVPTSI